MSGLRKRTIGLIISREVDKWLESIKDESVRNIAKHNTIVTGGSIASMLIGEKVNDYDIYFRNKETAIAVAEYYIAEFNSNNDLKAKVKGYAPKLKTITVKNILGEEEERVVIWMQSAGTAEEDQGVDYNYFESQPEFEAEDFLLGNDVPLEDPAGFAEDAADELKPSVKKPKYRPVFLTDNAITLSDKIQLIIRFWGNPSEIHRTFDFAHAMGYYDHSTKEVTVAPEALECMLSKTLVYKGSLYPVASLFRTRKFIKRGWRISAGQMLKIIIQLQGVDLMNRSVLKEQLIGVDMAYMSQLISELKNAEGKVDATYLGILIDKVFEE